MKGQATLWIILGIVLIGVIIIFLLFRGRIDNTPFRERGGEFAVDSFLDSCVGEAVKKAVDVILPQGGFANPSNFKLYNMSSIEYICETQGYFEPCINQHPMLIREMENEILSYIEADIYACLAELQREIERNGGTFTGEGGEVGAEAELEHDRIMINFERPITIRERETERVLESYQVEVKSPAYNLGVIALEIASQEADHCYFETAGYTLANPRYRVTRTVLSDQTKIYTIYDTSIKETMRVAVRSCALPEGMPG